MIRVVVSIVPTATTPTSPNCGSSPGRKVSAQEALSNRRNRRSAGHIDIRNAGDTTGDTRYTDIGAGDTRNASRDTRDAAGNAHRNTRDTRHVTSSSLLGAVARDVASLTTLVAGLTSSVQRSAVGGRAVARDVSELAAGITLHSLSLAVTGKVVGATALVAGGSPRTGETATAAKATSVGSTANRRTSTAHVDAGGVGACASQMARLAAVVAATAGAGTAQAQGRAVGLNMAKALAVVALLSLGGAREGALV